MQKTVDGRAEGVYLLFMTDEKNSATYKKYAKKLGKLYWEKNKNWNLDKGEYVYEWTMTMIVGISRRWGRGRYIYNLITLPPKGDWRDNYNVEATDIDNRIARGLYVEVQKNNPNPPEEKKD